MGQGDVRAVEGDEELVGVPYFGEGVDDLRLAMVVLSFQQRQDMPVADLRSRVPDEFLMSDSVSVIHAASDLSLAFGYSPD